MRDSIYRFTLDVHDISSQVQIVAKKNDNARKIYVTLMEYGKPYSLEDGCMAVMMIKKPDNNILFNDCYFINSGSVIAYDFTEQTSSVDGLCECEIRIYNKDHELITSPRFTILVNETVYDDGQIESTSEYTALTESMSDIANIREGIEEVRRAKADVEQIKVETEEFRDDTANLKDETSLIKGETEQIKADVDGLKDIAVQASLNAETSATEAEASKQYIIDHRDELKGEPGVIYKETEPTLPEERVGVWINPQGTFEPIQIGGGADIDDGVIATDKTWSSSKIDSFKSEFVVTEDFEKVTNDLYEKVYADCGLEQIAGAWGVISKKTNVVATYSHIVLDVSSAKYVKISGRTGGVIPNYSLYGFYDENMNLLNEPYGDKTETNYTVEVEVPNGAKFLYVNGNSNTSSNYAKIAILAEVKKSFISGSQLDVDSFEVNDDIVSTKINLSANIENNILPSLISNYSLKSSDTLIINDDSADLSLGNETSWRGVYVRFKIANTSKDSKYYFKITNLGESSITSFQLYRTNKNGSAVAVKSIPCNGTYIEFAETDYENYIYNGEVRFILTVNKGGHVLIESYVNRYGLGNKTLKEFITEDRPILENKKIMFLGDSITALTGDRSWVDKFCSITKATKLINVAVNSAVLNDYSDTVYDGNPSQSVQSNNTLGNQVQKIINNAYATPDVIMIAIGTNSGITADDTRLNNAYFKDANTLLPLNEIDKTTREGAFRWCNETLHNLYPKAIIVWCSPIQGSYPLKKASSVYDWNIALEKLCVWGSVYHIETCKCGIRNATEITSSMGEYLQDGLHPNAKGAMRMACYNADAVRNIVYASTYVDA